jgi:hypothetical protein
VDEEWKAFIRRQLVELLAKTASARDLPFGFVGKERAKARYGDAAKSYFLENEPASAAAKRQWADNEAAGRTFWHYAHQDAETGLAAFDEGKPEAAEGWLNMALRWYVAALEARVQPGDLKALSEPSARRGRGPKRPKWGD